MSEITVILPATEESRLSDELRRLTRAILKAHPRRRLWTGMGGTDGYGVEIDTPIFTMHPHDENPICNCGAEDAEEDTPCAETCPYGWPNFKHKPSGFAVHWHKWIGRSMEIVGAPPADLAAMIDECIASIPKGATP